MEKEGRSANHPSFFVQSAMRKRLLILGMLTFVIATSACTNSQPQPEPQETKPVRNKAEQFHRTELHRAVIPPPKPPKPFLPDKLLIPAVRIDADIDPVSVLDNGQMAVPDSTDRAGLLVPGTLPGENGNAVIDGHVDTYTGPAVFYRLKKLKKGDKVIVKNKKGSQLTFTVESVEAFKTEEAPIERIFGDAAEPRLNLITCTGKYSRKKREHEQRLIVFTKWNGGAAGLNESEP